MEEVFGIGGIHVWRKSKFSIVIFSKTIWFCNQWQLEFQNLWEAEKSNSTSSKPISNLYCPYHSKNFGVGIPNKRRFSKKTLTIKQAPRTCLDVEKENEVEKIVHIALLKLFFTCFLLLFLSHGITCVCVCV